MKVYIAAPFGRYREALQVAKELERRGQEVTSSWLKVAEELGGKDVLSHTAALEALTENNRDIDAADAALGLVWRGEGQEMFLEMARAEAQRGTFEPVWVSMDGGKLPLSAIANQTDVSLEEAYEYLTQTWP